MKPARVKRIVIGIIISVLIVGTLPFTSACKSQQDVQQNLSAQSPGIIEVSGMATEIVGPNISLNTAAGRPLVLKINGGTTVLRLDGSRGTTKDIRPGMSVKVSYDSSTLVCTSLQIQ